MPEKFLHDDIIPECKVSIGIDPSFGSKFGIVATRFVNERIEVFEAEEYERPDFNDNLIVIDKRFDKLLTALRTAVANEYELDKEQTSYHDLLDAFRLSLQLYQRSNK